MDTIDIDLKNLDAVASTLPRTGPVTMLNLLRYHPVATYSAGSGEAEAQPISGRGAYLTRYLPAFDRIAGPMGETRPIWVGSARSWVVGHRGADWDDVALVEYAGFDLFRRIVESEAYRRDADPHRRAALADWQLLALAPLTPLEM